ncbi:hypothetical protein Tco_0967597 [Tanacetum coccineum]
MICKHQVKLVKGLEAVDQAIGKLARLLNEGDSSSFIKPPSKNNWVIGSSSGEKWHAFTDDTFVLDSTKQQWEVYWLDVVMQKGFHDSGGRGRNLKKKDGSLGNDGGDAHNTILEKVDVGYTFGGLNTVTASLSNSTYGLTESCVVQTDSTGISSGITSTQIDFTSSLSVAPTGPEELMLKKLQRLKLKGFTLRNT